MKTGTFFEDDKHLLKLKAPYAINIFKVTNEALICHGLKPKREKIELINGVYNCLFSILQASMTPEFFKIAMNEHFSPDIFFQFADNYQDKMIKEFHETE